MSIRGDLVLDCFERGLVPARDRHIGACVCEAQRDCAADIFAGNTLAPGSHLLVFLMQSEQISDSDSSLTTVDL
jgi:hypothetical protein